MDTAGKIIIAIFMTLLAVAFTGADIGKVGIHPDCIDGVDNDGDGSNDFADSQCEEYPYADGGGEYPTTFGSGGKAFSSIAYENSVWEIHYQYLTVLYGIGDPDWCLAYNDPAATYNLAFYQTLYSPSITNYKDTSIQDYTDWYNANCP
jgi:hypothetical protein